MRAVELALLDPEPLCLLLCQPTFHDSFNFGHCKDYSAPDRAENYKHNFTLVTNVFGWKYKAMKILNSKHFSGDILGVL